MFVPTNNTARDLDTLPNSKANALVRNNDITTLGKRRNNTGNRRERLGVHDTRRSTQERRDIGLGLHVHVLRTVESTGTAGTHAVVAECLDGLLLESLVGVEVIEIERAEVRDGSSVGEFRFGSDGSVQ